MKALTSYLHSQKLQQFAMAAVVVIGAFGGSALVTAGAAVAYQSGIAPATTPVQLLQAADAAANTGKTNKA